MTEENCGIAVMAKAFCQGAKTRLVPPLTFEEAAALNTAFLQDVADNLLPRTGKRTLRRSWRLPAKCGKVFPRHLTRCCLIEAWLPNFGTVCCTRSEKFSRAGTTPLSC
jgi:hypothetical protein